MTKKKINIVSLQMIKEKVMWYSDRKIKSPEDAYQILKKFAGDSDREQMIMIALNTKNEPTHLQTISIGSLNASVVHPREVFKTAVLSNAANIILGHNHPSGDTEPSYEDIQITRQLVHAGELLGITVLDHIIFTNDYFKSLKEDGHI